MHHTFRPGRPLSSDSTRLAWASQRSWFSQLEMAYPGWVTPTPPNIQFAEEAGERIQQAFALCAFASELVGKASEE